MIKIWNILKNHKITKFIRYIREQLQNQKQNRQLVGEDRDGNKYYQYYSYYGLPTRRQIRWKINGDWQMKDLVYYRWLHKIQFDPPSQTQKQQFYLEQKLRYQRAAEWDKKQRDLIDQFKKKRQQLLLRNQALKQLQNQLNSKSQLNIISKRS